MSHLSDVEVLYELMGASHIPYREIKLEEAKALLNTPSIPLNEIDLSQALIVPATISEKTEHLLAGSSFIKHDLIVAASLPADSTILAGASQSVAANEVNSMLAFFTKAVNSAGVTSVNETVVNEAVVNEVVVNEVVVSEAVVSEAVVSEAVVNETSVNETPANETPVNINNASAEISSSAILVVQTPDQSNAQLMPNDQNANSEISSLMLRIKDSSNIDKALSKQSFFERLQA